MAEVWRIGLDEVVAHSQESKDSRSTINERQPSVILPLSTIFASRK